MSTFALLLVRSGSLRSAEAIVTLLLMVCPPLPGLTVALRVNEVVPLTANFPTSQAPVAAL